MSTQAQHHSDGNCQPESRQRPQREGPSDDFRDLSEFVDVPADHKDFAARQPMYDQPHFLHFAAEVVDPNDHGIGRDIRFQARRQAFHIARDAMTVGTEQTRNSDAAGILTQPVLRRTCCYDGELFGEQSVDPGSHVGGCLQIDETEQNQGAQNEGAGDRERPAKRRCACEIRQAHGE